jgi:hypothetical protein
VWLVIFSYTWWHACSILSSVTSSGDRSYLYMLSPRADGTSKQRYATLAERPVLFTEESTWQRRLLGIDRVVALWAWPSNSRPAWAKHKVWEVGSGRHLFQLIGTLLIAANHSLRWLTQTLSGNTCWLQYPSWEVEKDDGFLGLEYLYVSPHHIKDKDIPQRVIQY